MYHVEQKECPILFKVTVSLLPTIFLYNIRPKFAFCCVITKLDVHHLMISSFSFKCSRSGLETVQCEPLVR